MALPPPFETGSTTAGFAPGGDLQKQLTARLDAADAPIKAAFSHMGIALVDLTNIGEDPDAKAPFSVAYASNGAMAEKDMRVGSLSKIAAMYAAFQLRNRVKLAAGAVGTNAKDVDDLIKKIEADWKPLVTRKVKKSPQDFPNLKHIFNFTATSPWLPSFKEGGEDWDGLDAFHEKSQTTIDTLEFMQRLRLAIRFSDDYGAGSIVRDVSFQFMNGSLAEEGFNDNKRNGILWLGTDFGYHLKDPIMYHPLWAHENDPTWVRASAKGIASFLTLLWTNRLVDPAASKEMREILKERGVGYATVITNKTPKRGRRWSKVGLLKDYGTISEGFILESNTAGKHLRYAGAALDARSEDPLEELATIFNETVSAVH